MKFEVFIIRGRTKFYCLLIGLQAAIVITVVFSLNFIHSAVAQTASALTDAQATMGGYIAIAAALAIGLSVLGAGMAIKTTGTAAISALSENEGSFFKAFLVVALAESFSYLWSHCCNFVMDENSNCVNYGVGLIESKLMQFFFHENDPGKPDV